MTKFKLLIFILIFTVCSCNSSETSDVISTSDKNSTEKNIVEPVTTEKEEIEPQLQLSDISLQNGTLTGFDLLEKTDKGFNKWEWLNHSSNETYFLHNPYVVNENSVNNISRINYRDLSNTSDTDEQPIGITLEFDRSGNQIFSLSFSDEIGFRFRTFFYDELGRLEKIETRIGQSEDANQSVIQEDQSFLFSYYVPIDGTERVYRLAKTLNNSTFSIEYEYKLSYGWKYVIDTDVTDPAEIIIRETDMLIISVKNKGSKGDDALLLEYDENDRLIKSIQTKLDGKTPRFSYSNFYDLSGNLATTKVWNHLNDTELRLISFDDHDDMGNWMSAILYVEGEIESVIKRTIDYQ